MKTNELREFTAGLLDRLGVEGHRVVAVERESETVLDIELGSGEALFIADGNEALRALNTVVRRVAEKHAEKTATPMRIRVDINSRDTAHIEFLENQARVLAERARTLKQDVGMNPMSAYDRMVVHETLRGEAGVVTKSEGEGNLRHVVIRYVEPGI